MLNEVIAILTIYLIGLLVGYPITQWLMKESLNDQPPVLNLIMYIAIGLTILVPLYFIVSIYALTIYTSLFLSVFFLLLSIYIFQLKNIRDILRSWASKNNFILILLFLLIFIYFVKAVEYMYWPPRGDITFIHGPLVSIIEYNKKLPLTLEPLYPTQYIYYPVGMHVLIANLNFLLGEYPARAVFLFGAAIIILSPFLIYRFVYTITHSMLFSLISFIWIFYIHTWHLERWLIGYFYNGPYANLFGFMIIFGYINFLTLNFKNKKIEHIILGWLIFSTSLFLIYPSFFVLIFLHLLILITNYKKEFIPFFKKYYGFIFLIVISSAYFIFFNEYGIKERFWYIFGKIDNLNVLKNVEQRSYILTLSYFWNINGIGILFATVLSMFFLMLKRFNLINILYLIIIFVVLLSQIPIFYPFIWFFLPDRIIVIASILWLPIIFTLYITLKKSYNINVQTSRMRKSIKLFKVTIIIIFVLSFSLITFSPYIVGDVNKKYGYFSNTPYFSYDFKTIRWADENIPPNDLILDDRSYSSLYLTSLSIKNVTYNLWAVQYQPQRAKDLLVVWEKPYEKYKIFSILNRYDVRYILLTSEPGYYADATLGGDKTYKPKPYKSSEYIKIFDNYEFLHMVFSVGNYTRVYKFTKDTKT